MRRTAVYALAGALALLVPAPARAQVYGMLSGGSLVPVNGHTLGGTVEISSDLVGVMGQLRSSFYPGVDFGFHGGLAFYDIGASDLTAVRLGADFKVQVAGRDSLMAFDVLVGGALGVETGDDLNVLRLGPGVVVSRGFPDGPDPRFRPYLALQVLFSREEVRGTRESGLVAPLHLGSELKLTQGIRVLAEAQWRIGNDFGDDVAITTGITTDF